jgi:phospholipid/cholesterol/gamma-HCH transport system substrate-binding protein
MKNKPYIRVGILFLAAIIIIFWGINYLKGKDIFNSERPYFAVYEKIGGLTNSSPVTLNGFQVGQVREINLSEKSPGKIEVKFSITHKTLGVPSGTIARIYSTDLMGTKGLALDFTDSKEFVPVGDTLKGAIEGDIRDQVNAQMLPLKMKAEELMSSMDSVLAGLQLVFSDQNQQNLSQSFTSVNKALDNLEAASIFLNEYVREESKKVTFLLSNVDSLSRSLKDQTGELQGFIANMNRFSDTLASVELAGTFLAIQHVLEDLHQLTQTVASGEGSLGNLIYSDSLYQALLSTNASINRLIEDIRINPGRYVRVALNDRSKSVYTTSDTELARILGNEGTSDYYICLLQSPYPLKPGDPELKGIPDGQFIQIGAVYYYYVFHSRKINPCLDRLTKLRKNHPSAGIFTWINGKWTRLVI